MSQGKLSTSPKARKKAGARSPKRRKFVEGLIEGKSMRRAVLDAGYSRSMANNASHRIMPGARDQFEAELDLEIPTSKLIQRIMEGLDARKTKLATFNGKFTDRRSMADFEIRRRYVELVCNLKGYSMRETKPRMNLQRALTSP